VARHIMKPDPISIKIVENCQAKLIALSVIRLWTLGAENSKFYLEILKINLNSPSSVRPVNIIVSLTRGPFYSIPIVDLSTGPEVPLSVFSDQSQKFPFLCRTVETDCSHAVGTAECLPFTLGELGASHSPTYQEILSLIRVIWFKSSTFATSSSVSSSFRSSVSILVSVWSSVIRSSILLLTTIPESVVVVVVVIPVVISIPL